MRPLWAARGEDTRRAATTSPRPHRHISAGADVAVAQVRRLLGSEFVLALQARQPVFRVCRHSGIFRCLEVEPVEAGRIYGEDQLLYPPVGGTQRRGAVFFFYVLTGLEPPPRPDLPLLRAAPHPAGTPHDMHHPPALY